MTHKLPLLTAWAVFSVLTVVANVLVIMTFINEKGLPQFLIPQPKANISISANSATPTQNDVLGIQTSIQEDDARIKIISNFLERYNSPLEPYSDWGQKLVTIADKYGIDFRLLPAIAMTESNLCKVIPPGTYNCTGYGITSTGTLGFESYEESFEATAKSLKKNYVDKGLTNPSDIMKKYTPSSNGSWQNSVNQWLSEMKYDDHAKGLDLKTNADLTQYVTATPSAIPFASP